MTDREARRDAERVEHILDAAAKLAEIVAEGREAFDTSWRQRDFIAHSYFKVDPDLVWDAIAVSVPDLAAALRAPRTSPAQGLAVTRRPPTSSPADLPLRLRTDGGRRGSSGSRLSTV